MTQEKLKRISNIIFWATTAFAVITLGIVGKDYFAMAGQGVCPISQHNGLIYTALGLLLASIIITSILDSRAKKIAASVEDETSIYDQTLESLKQEADVESMEVDAVAEAQDDRKAEGKN